MGHCQARCWGRCGQEGHGQCLGTVRGPEIALPVSAPHWEFQGTRPEEPRDHYHSTDTQQMILEGGWRQVINHTHTHTHNIPPPDPALLCSQYFLHTLGLTWAPSPASHAPMLPPNLMPPQQAKLLTNHFPSQ